MHTNPAFRQTSHDDALAVARARSFGVLCLNGENGPLVSHVPFELSPDGSHAFLHLTRSNPIARAALPLPAVMVVSGPDAYVSPDWYGSVQQSPHRGAYRVLSPQAGLLALLLVGGVFGRYAAPLWCRRAG